MSKTTTPTEAPMNAQHARSLTLAAMSVLDQMVLAAMAHECSVTVAGLVGDVYGATGLKFEAYIVENAANRLVTLGLARVQRAAADRFLINEPGLAIVAGLDECGGWAQV